MKLTSEYVKYNWICIAMIWSWMYGQNVMSCLDSFHSSLKHLLVVFHSSLTPDPSLKRGVKIPCPPPHELVFVLSCFAQGVGSTHAVLATPVRSCRRRYIGYASSSKETSFRIMWHLEWLKKCAIWIHIPVNYRNKLPCLSWNMYTIVSQYL